MQLQEICSHLVLTHPILRFSDWFSSKVATVTDAIGANFPYNSLGFANGAITAGKLEKYSNRVAFDLQYPS
ncbi:hypothetical protein BDZ89DRAFT_1059190 [Hymenopellis radicata]|nr:hypothetical protein BDZ89DRAFT_1059190 [Hymenopellis radicata]